MGPLVGGSRVGATVYLLPPGEALCPYHYEWGEEEWLIVLEGRPVVRHPEGTETLEPWDVVCFPRGPEGAHKVYNETDDPVRVLMFSEVVYPSATSYPDSDKVGVWMGDRKHDLLVERSSAVEYYKGETAD
jgi:uncharacterized cupin superfamily protein